MAAVCRFVLASLSLAFALPLAAQQYRAEMLSGLFDVGQASQRCSTKIGFCFREHISCLEE